MAGKHSHFAIIRRLGGRRFIAYVVALALSTFVLLTARWLGYSPELLEWFKGVLQWATGIFIGGATVTDAVSIWKNKGITLTPIPDTHAYAEPTDELRKGE